MPAKVLLVIGDAAEAMDTLYPFFRLKEAGYQVVVAGPAARVYHLVMHEIPPGWDITREGPSYHLAADIAFANVVPEDYLGLFISGGRAPEYLRYDAHLLALTRHFFATRKPVASVCHGVEIIAAADVIRGRRVATVAKCALDVEFSGGHFVNEGCVRDGNLVSGRTWHDNHLFMGEFVKMLAEAAAA
ncbi:MAG: DJ-1/PfpI family protein [Bryobacteraceae bacterium]|nr:DJ-1/PfpI family protein [Bryobacteraceae bacterium]